MSTCPTCGNLYPDGVRFCPGDGGVLDDEQGEDQLVGQILKGTYRIDALLSEGGMGMVYRATHLTLRKPVAVKVIKPEFVTSADCVRRFQREARAASNLNHPNIIVVYDLGETENGGLYLAMELVDGPNLKEVTQTSGPLEPNRIVTLLLQLASALSLAHKHGIVHRDLKPHNIMLPAGADGREVVKLLDFGIAKTFDESPDYMTEAGFIVGTPPYMSPEQATGQPVDVRSDIYSLGVILYEMLVGDVPFHAASRTEVLAKQVHQQPTPPSERRPDLSVPPALEAIALRCLEKDPSNRFQTAAELAVALASVGSSTTPIQLSTSVRLLDVSKRKSFTPASRWIFGAFAISALVIVALTMLQQLPGETESATVRSPAVPAPKSDSSRPPGPAPAGMTWIRPGAVPGAGSRLEVGVWMGTTEVTNAEYATFLRRHGEWRRGALPPSRHDGDYLKLWASESGPPELDSHPVVFVTWDAAEAYCQAGGGRLPTEGEWEYAARASSSSRYWWGDSFDPSRANNANRGTERVGNAAHVNAFGLADMPGNVWEWTSSGNENVRVVRGGGWREAERFLESGSAQVLAPQTAAQDLGFRCVR